jgi:hypothetical protein
MLGFLWLLPSPIPTMRELPPTEDPDEPAEGKAIAVS